MPLTSPVKRLQKRYAFAILIILLALISSDCAIRTSLIGLEHDAKTINTAGKQRMLGERAIRMVFLLSNTTENELQQYYASKLQETYKQLQSIHNQLQSNHSEIGLQHWESKAELEALYLQLAPYYQMLESQILLVLSAQPSGYNTEHQRLEESLSKYVSLMDKIVFLYQSESTSKIKHNNTVVFIASISIGILVLLQAALIFFPSIRYIDRFFNQSQARFSELLEKNGYIRKINQNLTQNQEKLEEQAKDLQGARQEAENASMAKSEFLANMSHELKTPLNSIMGFSELLLLDDNFDESQKQFLTDIRNSGETLLKMVNNMLDFNDIQDSAISIQPTKTPLLQLLQESTSPYLKPATRKGVFLIQHFDENLPEQVFVDALRLKQILNNLLDNAVKFTNAGGYIKLIATLENQTPTKSTILFSVVDSGVGVPPLKQKAILDYFTQANSDFTKRFAGIGLGLSISSQLLQMMDSQLYFSSDEQKGSIFFFKLTLPYVAQVKQQGVYAS